MRFVLPYPISANRYWRNFRGRAVVSSEAREYKALASALATTVGVQPVAGKVALALTLHPRKPKRKSSADVRCMDLDNALMVAIDALNGVAFVDDSQVVDLRITRGEPVDLGALVVEVTA